jgi:ribosomal protein L9
VDHFIIKANYVGSWNKMLQKGHLYGQVDQMKILISILHDQLKIIKRKIPLNHQFTHLRTIYFKNQEMIAQKL